MNSHYDQPSVGEQLTHLVTKVLRALRLRSQIKPDNLDRTTRARIYIFVCTIAASSAPFFFVWGQADAAPLTFATTVAVFMAGFSLLASTAVYLISLGHVANARLKLGEAMRNSKKLILIGVLCNTDRVFFGWALVYLSPIVAVMLYDTWPVWVLCCMFLPAFRSLRRPDTNKVALWLALILCIFGSTLIAGSESLEFDVLELFSLDIFESSTAIGLLSGATAGLVVGLHIACSRRLAEKLSNHLEKPNNTPMDIFCELTAFATIRVPGAVALFAVAVVFGKELSNINFIAAPLCAMATLISSVSLRMAHRLAPGYSIQAVRYFAPILSLIWLYLGGFAFKELPWETLNIGTAEVEQLAEFLIEFNWDYLLIGVATVLTGNLIATFSVDRSTAFKGWVISLWLFGLIIYHYDAPPFRTYYESIAAVVTIFVLLLSFRADRLARRIEREEADTIWLWWTIARNSLPGCESVARRYLHTIITSRQVTHMQTAHEKLQHCLRRDTGEAGDELRIRLGVLVNSRQQGTNKGELVAIAVLGCVAIGGLLGFLPNDAQRGSSIGLFVELSALLLSASIVFLFFCIWDLQRERSQPPVDVTKSVNIRQADIHQSEVVIAIGASLLILVAYSVALWRYWLG